MGSPSLLPSAPTSSRTRSRTRSRRLRIPGIVLLILGTVLYVQFVLIPKTLFQTPESVVRLSEYRWDILDEGLRKCRDANTSPVQYEIPTAGTRQNPRWNSVRGQNGTVVLKNAVLFDGVAFSAEPVNIVFSKGVITTVSPVSEKLVIADDEKANAAMIDLRGKHVTPGLVDMHSHHLAGSWPSTGMSRDENEVHPDSGPLTPFVRSLDGMKPYDTATAQIASGGVTSSLILPGSANIMGGEAFPVKNIVGSGENGEQIVEEMLLEHGIAKDDRRRYLKMACGENPKRLYKHNRMGNAWVLRHHMARGAELKKQQDAWCLSAAAARDTADEVAIAALVRPGEHSKGGFPEELELDSTVAMLRGKININVHCYEVEDFEDMLLHSEEFGFHISAFHHALSAWKVPELIKASGQNITVATFSDFGIYKHEAYAANLYAGKILAEHGVPVAYKSDHVEQRTSAKYLLFQAAHAHHFGLDASLALQAVTSVPANSLQLGHRIGYIRPGYDADIVVWDSHPLALGATPLQVYIDGKATLDEGKVKDSLSKKKYTETESQPKMEPSVDAQIKDQVCERTRKPGARIVVKGISKSYTASSGVVESQTASNEDEKMTMIIKGGKIICQGDSRECVHDETTDTVVTLEDGHVLPGVVAYTAGLGLIEVEDAPETGDGVISRDVDPLDPNNVVYAKYGVHLDGRPFDRARLGGIMRAITAPLMEKGFLRGVSTGMRTAGNYTSLEQGIFQEDVALHFSIGQVAKDVQKSSTISAAVGKLRRILSDNKDKDNIYGKAAQGHIPLVVYVENKYDILQMIRLKKDYRHVNLVLVGASESHLVAPELARADIPVIVTAPRGHPDTFEKRETLSGPPMTKSLVSVLHEAGVRIALANDGEGAAMGASFIQNLLLEASWAAQYAGLSDEEAIGLVTTQFEEILGLHRSADLVIYEGNPLQLGARVVLAIDGDHHDVVDCWPEGL